MTRYIRLGLILACLVGAAGPAAAQTVPAAASDNVTLNFPSADVHEVAKAVLGDILGLNYSVDASVHGTVTLVTAQPTAKAEVLPLFETALKGANLTLVHVGSIYTIVSLEDARKRGQLVDSADAGYGTEAIPLHYVSAAELKKLIDPIVPDKSIAQADAGRNILLVTGSGDERRAVRELAQEFDVDWMRGMAFALFVPQRLDSKTLTAELDQMLNGPGMPTSGMVHLVSIDRLNGILAITKQPSYLNQVRRLVLQLDQQGHQGERRLFVYHVQNGRASDLAGVLVNAFGGSSKSGGQTSTLPAPGISTSTIQPLSPMGSGGDSSTASNGLGSVLSSVNQGVPASASVPAQTLLLGSSLSPVTISSDENTNSIIVYSTASEYQIVADALRKLDTQPLQVLIEAAIAEVTLNDALRYGVQWDFQAGDSQFKLSDGLSGLPKPRFPGFSYLISSGNTISATLNALSKITSIHVVSAPKLLVLNNHTASLQVGDEVPIATQSAVGVITADAPIVNSIQYQATGVILKVTPRVNDSGLVLLDISQEVSEVSTTETSNIDSPTIQDREVSTSVGVQDGKTVALGGLIRDSKSHTLAGLPVLSDIPILGNLFSSTDDEHDRTELIILLTPRVVRNPADAQSITDELRQKMRSLEPLSTIENATP